MSKCQVGKFHTFQEILQNISRVTFNKKKIQMKYWT